MFAVWVPSNELCVDDHKEHRSMTLKTLQTQL